MGLKKAIVFCYGDSTLASTWSNVPYLMLREFERRGVEIVRVNIAPGKLISKIFNKIMSSVFGKKYSWIRTPLFTWQTERKIRKNVRKNVDADWCVFFNFDFCNRYSSVPSLLFSDWTYKILLEDRLKVEPARYEYRFMNQQLDAISRARLVVPLFNESYEKMRLEYPHANIKLISGNVVNNLDEDILSAETIISEKQNRHYIWFIGKPAYKTGLLQLIEALQSMENPLSLHVIGMSEDSISCKCHYNITFHGYLHKENVEERVRYYNLLKGASAIINPTKGWGAYSSIVEAMYFYTPVVVSPFEQFVLEFGDKIDFGEYIYTDNPKDLATVLKRLLSTSRNDYRQLCLNAHDKVKDYTWKNYVEKLMLLMEKYKISDK